MIFAINTPEAVPIANAITPNTKIPKVSAVRNFSASSCDPTLSPKKIVTILIKEFCTTSLNLSTT